MLFCQQEEEKWDKFVSRYWLYLFLFFPSFFALIDIKEQIIFSFDSYLGGVALIMDPSSSEKQKHKIDQRLDLHFLDFTVPLHIRRLLYSFVVSGTCIKCRPRRTLLN